MTLKLYYFQAGGRGALLRLMMHIYNIPFEDLRHSREEWPTVKPKMPLNQVPVLQLDDGKMLCQSDSIGLYIATRAGITPSCPLKSSIVLSVCASLWEAAMAGRELFFASEEEAPKIKDKINADVTARFAKVDKYISQWEKDGYVLGDDKKNTMADYAIFCLLNMQFPSPHLDKESYFKSTNTPACVRISQRVRKEVESEIKKMPDFEHLFK